MGRKKYNIEDLYNIDVKQFIDIFDSVPDDNAKGSIYRSDVFESLPYEEKLELFEVYILKYFYFIYSNDIRNVSKNSASSDALGEFSFSEISVTLDALPGETQKREFIFTIEYFKSNDNKVYLNEISLWVQYAIPSHERSEVGFSILDTKSSSGLEFAKKLSSDLYDILKHAYEQLVQEEELYAWYLLNGIDLKRVLLQEV